MTDDLKGIIASCEGVALPAPYTPWATENLECQATGLFVNLSAMCKNHVDLIEKDITPDIVTLQSYRHSE